mmetsp:Transcript_29161/g.43947  ORF Transcript_29161/g.43947 Transcript_29161/m.43947 type:complete len:194 (-) Transcript_29161:1358-1939(-)
MKENPIDYSVSVCDAPCVFSETSDAANLYCEVPPISTLYSILEFEIASETHDLDSGRYFGSSEDAKILWDDDITIELSDDSDQCFAGMEFKQDHVAVLSQVKYFMGSMTDKLLYAGFLKFEASNDKADWSTLFTADVNIHEGWNYYNWDDPEEYPSYRYYRFYSSQKGGCNMREVTFRGVETIQDTNEQKVCE